MNRLIARVLGEAVGTGTSVRSDQQPQHPEPEIPPVPEGPDDEHIGSMADKRQREAQDELGEISQVETVMAMWRSGNKYDACKYMLFSNYLYTDFIRLIQQMPEGEALEMGGILDETAPTYSGPQYQPSDEVSAVAGAGLEMMDGSQSTQPA